MEYKTFQNLSNLSEILTAVVCRFLLTLSKLTVESFLQRFRSQKIDRWLTVDNNSFHAQMIPIILFYLLIFVLDVDPSLSAEIFVFRRQTFVFLSMLTAYVIYIVAPFLAHHQRFLGSHLINAESQFQEKMFSFSQECKIS